MDITKSSIWGLLALVVLLAILIGVRSHLLTQRVQCAHRLEQLVPMLDTYASAHRGQMPATLVELDRLLGQPLPTSTIPASSGQSAGSKLDHLVKRPSDTDSLPFRMAAHPCCWKTGTPAPYLWDARPHEYVGGVHVLYTDGSVRVEDNIPTP